MMIREIGDGAMRFQQTQLLDGLWRIVCELGEIIAGSSHGAVPCE
jgi:hypothetical protein